MSEWQTIDTAPKVRDMVIVAVPTKHNDGYLVGEAFYEPAEKEWWWSGDWTRVGLGPSIDETIGHPPSHWMPLPEPPSI